MAKPRGKPFTGKGDPRNGPPIHEQVARKKETVQPYVPPPDDGAPPVLQDMRHVYQNGAEHDTRYAHAHLRAWLQRDQTGFIREMNAMESKHQAEQNEQGPEEERDMGTERCIKLCEDWLGEHGVKQQE